MASRIFLVGMILIAFVPQLSAQWIHIRTVPVIATQQTGFSPSVARGMGNLSIAYDDYLADPFFNPASGASMSGVTVFSSPMRSSWSNKDGGMVATTRGSSNYPGSSINSIPFGVFIHHGEFFGSALVAHQHYSGERVQSDFSPIVTFPTSLSPTTRSDVGNNTYFTGSIGKEFPESKLAVGASIHWAKLSAIDGVNLLYPGSTDLKQDGWMLESRIGMLVTPTPIDKVEFIAGVSRFKATHEVTYSGWFGQRIAFPTPEINKDESNEWMLHGAYTRKIDDHWKLGGIITVNWKDHPKIPNYALANIPRDPGTSAAYNLGVGTVWESGRSLWGLEYVYEPITSNTWAEAGEDPILIQSYPPNFKTVENFFDFDNHIVRVGHQSNSKLDWLEYRFGVQFHFYKYSLNQNDNVLRRSRSVKTDWLESTLSGGVTARFSNIQLMYTLQLVLGNGLVGTVSQPRVWLEGGGGVRLATDFLIAPSGDLVVTTIPLVLQQATFVYTIE